MISYNFEVIAKTLYRECIDIELLIEFLEEMSLNEHAPLVAAPGWFSFSRNKKELIGRLKNFCETLRSIRDQFPSLQYRLATSDSRREDLRLENAAKFIRVLQTETFW